MSVPPLRIEALIDGVSFSPCERVPFLLSVANDGVDIAYVPDPFEGGPSLLLTLKTPSQQTTRLRPGEIPPFPGTRHIPVNCGIPTGDEAIFEADLGQLFPLDEPGRYSLFAEYQFSQDSRWVSPEIVFVRDAPGGVFLDVIPNDGSAMGYHGIVWVERSNGKYRALGFDKDESSVIVGAFEFITALPAGAKPIMSSSPAGLPFSERWVAWLEDGKIQARFFAHGDTGLTLAAAPISIPDGLQDPQLLRPLLAEQAPDEGRPRCMVGLLSKTGKPGLDLYLFEIDRNGTSLMRSIVHIEQPQVAVWAAAPNPEEQQIVFVAVSTNSVHVTGLSTFWNGDTTELRPWGIETADGFLGGDMRAQMDGTLQVGLVLLKANAWHRVVLGSTGRVITRDEDATTFRAPAGAEVVDVGIDESAGIHILYRQEATLFYLPPHSTTPAWTDNRLGSRGLDPHLCLQRGRRSVAVYDLDRGPRLEEL